MRPERVHQIILTAKSFDSVPPVFEFEIEQDYFSDREELHITNIDRNSWSMETIERSEQFMKVVDVVGDWQKADEILKVLGLDT